MQPVTAAIYRKLAAAPLAFLRSKQGRRLRAQAIRRVRLVVGRDEGAEIRRMLTL
jgi:hypothetical protein